MYVYLQSIQAYLSPPIAAVFLVGIFWNRLSGAGALSALILGGFLGVLRMIQQWSGTQWFSDLPLLHLFFSMNFLHFAIFLFGFTFIFMVVFSLLTQRISATRINNYLLGLSDLESFIRIKSFLATSSKPDRHAWFLSAALLVVLISLWGIFF
jgi:SSS family solute:Na+ symporter